MTTSFHFDQQTTKQIDRFALTVVKEYGRYIAGEGEPTDEAGQLFGCAVFAHYLSKCNHASKILREKGIPVDSSKCMNERQHFFLCSGTVFCHREADALVRCVKGKNITDPETLNKECGKQYDEFLDCYRSRLKRDYASKIENVS